MFEVKPIEPSLITRTDSTKITSVIRSTNDTVEQRLSQAVDVLTESVYDNHYGDGIIRDRMFYKATHIKLVLPIVNVVLAGRDCGVLKKIIGSSIDCAELSQGGCILQVSDNDRGYDIINPNDIKSDVVYDSTKHYIGGRAVRFLLDRVDVEQRLSRVIYSSCVKYVPYSLRKLLPNASIGTITKDSGDLWVIDEYYIKVSDLRVINYLKDNLDKIRAELLECEDGKGSIMPEITALLAFRDDPNRFKDMIQGFIPVLPLGFRPTIEKKKDPLSVLYNRVVQANLDVENIIFAPSCKLNVVRCSYVTLYYKYIGLILEKAKYDDNKFKTLIDILTGKEGVIRNNVQSTTIDFSGRSVITVDPTMSVDTIGIPKEMAFNLCELGAVRKFKSDNINRSDCFDDKYHRAMVEKAAEILKGLYVLAGRQPTLYNLGIQAFKVKIVDGYSIVMNPIVTPAFNADFDGDQMHVNLPQTERSQKEARVLMANVNNIFLPRDGTCHIAPRHEMIYGLYKCYKAVPDVGARKYTYADNNVFLSRIFRQLTNQDVHIDDCCTIGNKSYETIGKAALKIILGPGRLQDVRLGVTPITFDESIPEKMVKGSFYKEFFKYVRLNYSVDTYVKIVNQTVQLGFVVANLYPPDINVLKNIDTSDLKKEFEESTRKREEYYYLGFDTSSSFNLYYSTEYNKLEKKVIKRVKDTLGEDNGFIQLIESGARGDDSNLLQLFGMKGMILKNQVEAFTSIIETPLSEQLTGLEHNITAYGSRQGIIDKVIGTYAPGYLSRKMSHAARNLSIVSEDCGTTDGILFTYSFLVSMYGVSRLDGEGYFNYVTIKNYACKILEGRIIVGGVKPLSLAEAEEVFITHIAKYENDSVIELDGVKMRSPLCCKDQCCCKCYGVDLATNRMVVVGTPVGHLAGPTIGEPVTQLIMKNFQKGGVAGLKNLTSSFDTLSDLLEMFSVSKGESKDVPIVHDFISPVEGFVKTVSKRDGTCDLLIVDEKGKNNLRQKVVVYEDVELKDYVKVGDSIQKEEGTLDINEILAIRGVDTAQMFMLFNAYNIFVNEVYVNFKYFEILVSGMTFYMCTKSNNNFKTGHYYTLKDYTIGNKDGAEFIKLLRGLKQAEKVKDDFFTAIYLEDVGTAMMRNVAISGKDRLVDPFVRATLGLNPGIGSDVDDYLEKRGI